MTERMVEANGVELCTQPFGDPAHAPLLLIMGTGASMLWWEEGFCQLLADGGRFVIRYDHRDTGRSVTYEPGRPGYTGADLVGDACGVLDAYGIGLAHLVGVSAGGGSRSSSRSAPPIASARSCSSAPRPRCPAIASCHPRPPSSAGSCQPPQSIGQTPSPSSITSSATHACSREGGASSPRRRCEASCVDDVKRARDFAAVQNHDMLPEGEAVIGSLSSIAAPTLVIHGTADPMFAIEHGEALAREIPAARLLRLDGAGHGIDRADWETIAGAILAHTAHSGSSTT